jgi:lipopolysaccharide export system protein LptA
MTNVVVVKKRTLNVNAASSVIDSHNPVTLKNFPALGAINRIDKMLDVDASLESNGATLVYDSSNDRYIVKQLDLSDVTGVLDGGEF